MKTVALAYAIEHGEKTLIGVASTIDGAIDLIKKSGYGFDMTDDEVSLLRILLYSVMYTVNRKVNFKIETWEVH